MTDIPPSLTAFRGVRDLAPDKRLALGEGNQVRESGTQHRTNIFARAWDFLTRSRDEVESNKQVAREFVRGLKEAYGEEVAGMASRELKTHLAKGRPLTAYRVERLLARSETMAGRIEAGNRDVLGRALGRIENSSIERAFGGEVSDVVLTREERLEVIQRAIEGDPAFREVPFQTPLHRLVEELGGDHDELAPLDQAFIDRFAPIATRALERAAEEKLLPGTMAILERDCGPGVNVRDEMLVYTPRRLGLDEDQSMTFAMVSTQFRSITDSLVAGHSPLGVVLGQIGLLRDQTSEGGREGEPRIRDFALEGPAREYRDALLQDMRALERTLGDTIGFGALPAKGQEALLDGYIRGFGISDSIQEGSVKRLGDSAPQDLAKLREDLEVMNGLEPQEEKSRSLLEVVRAQTEKAIALLEACERAKTQGVTLEDIATMSRSGLDIGETLARISDTGFGGGDIQRLRDLNLPVGETVARFTREEARLLREAGVGIELGLQYKERGIPIHPRTLAREFTDDRVVGEPRLLGGGALSKPYEVSYDGRVMVFKEAKPREGFGPQSTLLGIDPEDSRMAVRNLTTRLVDELLGFGLVPETAFGTLDGKLGVVMDFARGASPSKNRTVDITDTDSGRNLKMLVERFPEQSQDLLEASQARIEDGRVLATVQFGVTDFDFTDPSLRRELVKLQLLDALTAQGDRHPGNYVLELGANGRFDRLRAIDNDQAFGPKMVNPNQLLHIGGGTSPQDVDGLLFGSEGFNGVLLPGIVDREIKESFDQLTPEGLRQELAGLLPEKEIEATILRLHTIKTHLARLERSGMVIGPDEWGGAKAGRALESKTQSYVGREREYIKTLEPIRYEEVKS